MRAPRRHPATAAAADLAGWQRRWGASAADEAHILGVQSWLRKIAKERPARDPKPAAKGAKPAAKAPKSVATAKKPGARASAKAPMSAAPATA